MLQVFLFHYRTISFLLTLFFWAVQIHWALCASLSGPFSHADDYLSFNLSQGGKAGGEAQMGWEASPGHASRAGTQGSAWGGWGFFIPVLQSQGV